MPINVYGIPRVVHKILNKRPFFDNHRNNSVDDEITIYTLNSFHCKVHVQGLLKITRKVL